MTARYDGMPSAAIAANAVDFVLAPDGIAKELARLGKHAYLRGDALRPRSLQPPWPRARPTP